MGSPAARPRPFAPHDPKPQSLKSILGRTTSIPLYCHPKAWSDFHLDVLRVKCLDKSYPLEHVVGRPLRCDPADKQLQAVVDEITEPVNEDGAFQGLLLCGQEWIRGFGPHRTEEAYRGLCYSWLRILRDDVREYPMLDSAPDTVYLKFFFGGETALIKGPAVMYDYPDLDDYPDGLYPVVSFLCLNHDEYRPRNAHHARWDRGNPRVKVWRRRSKPAEHVSLLLAMAQKQAQLLDKKRFDCVDNPLLNAFHPVLVIVSETTVRILRAHVTLNYLNALADPTLPLLDNLIVEQSEPFDMLVEADRVRYLITASCLLDEYYLDIRPIFSQRKPKEPEEDE
ncbi:predicted protein [Uncinocarpus reesii 1704]|uniref:Uncharacterized protein n=1 Tax=Uncinocarpus reesii (strain UAMH 1704) TaxID=336963 RepID=C4JZ44_UNCRE|nr:uncharacterized protein UREG_07445 [Uncinocarpus reesii 1704]EEP82580.1 predicted protein [Uncinocarpus reesii 1704]